MIQFPEWAPDQPPIGASTLADLRNVLPVTLQKYGPLPQLQAQGNALDARCQGAFSARGIGGTNVTVSGDAGKLYNYDGSAWADASKSGGYSTQSTDGWDFSRFIDLIIAVNGTNNPQAFTIESSTAFDDLTGSPPVGRFTAVVGPHTFIGRIASHLNRVVWSAEDDPTGWTPGTGLSDVQDLPTGGQVMGLVGGEYLISLMESAIYRGNYVGADPVFTFDRITRNFGCAIEGSLASFEQMIFFASWDGFYMLEGGQDFTLIGREKVDKTFWGTVNQNFLNRVSATVDPVRRLYCISFPSLNSTDGTPDTTYFYAFDLERWTQGTFNLELLFPYRAGHGYNTDTIDTVIGNTDATSYSVDTPLFLGAATPSLAAFGTDHKLATLDGANAEGRILTSETEFSPGFMSKVTAVRPIIDCPTTQVSVYARKTAQGSPTVSGPKTINSRGDAPFRKVGRYHAAEFIMPAGATWSAAQGLDASYVQEGKR